jgi:hypothetical protein
MIIESERTPAESDRTLRNGSFGVAPVPGTSCQATIAPSLRDISQPKVQLQLASRMEWAKKTFGGEVKQAS